MLGGLKEMLYLCDWKEKKSYAASNEPLPERSR